MVAWVDGQSVAVATLWRVLKSELLRSRLARVADLTKRLQVVDVVILAAIRTTVDVVDVHAQSQPSFALTDPAMRLHIQVRLTDRPPCGTVRSQIPASLPINCPTHALQLLRVIPLSRTRITIERDTRRILLTQRGDQLVHGRDKLSHHVELRTKEISNLAQIAIHCTHLVGVHE